jgi:hypothetical protein
MKNRIPIAQMMKEVIDYREELAGRESKVG